MLDSGELAEQALAPLMAPLDMDPDLCLCISLDAEWNMSRHVGVSILQLAPHSTPDSVFILPVCSKLYHQYIGKLT